MTIISEKCLSTLPFEPQPLSAWARRSDLLRYLRALYDRPLTLVDESGAERTQSTVSFGNTLYYGSRSEFRRVADEFTQKVVDALFRAAPPSVQDGSPRKGTQVEVLPLRDDPVFGQMAKYAAAWDCTVLAVLEESALPSLAHILESKSDLECSILLASHMYYKQALDILRNYFENTVARVYFSGDEAGLTAWASGRLGGPPFHGPEGMLQRLVSKGILAPDLAGAASELHRALTAAIEEARGLLLDRDESAHRPWYGPFGHEWLHRWCELFSRCVDLAIRTLRIQLLWESACDADGVVRCVKCNGRGFEREECEVDGHRRLRLTCTTCGHTMTLGPPSDVYVFFDGGGETDLGGLPF